MQREQSCASSAQPRPRAESCSPSWQSGTALSLSTARLWLRLPKEGVGDPCSQHVEQLCHGASSPIPRVMIKMPRAVLAPATHLESFCSLGQKAVTKRTENGEQLLARQGLQRAGTKSI